MANDVLYTLCHRIYPVRQESNENSAGNADDLTVFDLTTKGDFANMPATAIDLQKHSLPWSSEVERGARVQPILQQNGLEFFFAGGSAAAKTFSWKIYAWRNENGPARYVATGTGEIGTQAVVKYPHNEASATNKFWADNLVVTWENWPKEIESSDTGNSNSYASIFLDASGYRYWYIEIDEADGSTAPQAGDVSVWMGYW